MANTIIKGEDLMLFDSNKKSMAYATNHTLSLSGDVVDISTKDHGIWGASEVNKITWEITTENLYTEEDFNELFDKMIEREPITVYFGRESESKANGENVVNGDYTNWTPSIAKGVYKGDAFITSLQANASNGDKATYSATLTGVGKIERVTSLS